MNEFELKDLKFENGESVLEWDKIDLNDYFIFYKPHKDSMFEKTGFKFMSIQVTSFSYDEPKLFPDNYVEILYWGWAAFDGIRHMYLGDEKTQNFGYMNYPTILKHIEILTELRNLEKQYCRDID